MTPGQIVISKRGRDKNRAMIVLNVSEGYLMLVDGSFRTLKRPKKKKIKHIQPTNYVVDLTTEGRALQDADIRNHLSAFAGRR